MTYKNDQKELINANKLASDIKNDTEDLVFANKEKPNRLGLICKRIRDTEDSIKLKKLETQTTEDYFNEL